VVKRSKIYKVLSNPPPRIHRGGVITCDGWYVFYLDLCEAWTRCGQPSELIVWDDIVENVIDPIRDCIYCRMRIKEMRDRIVREVRVWCDTAEL
jgi:hypothetical protein